MLQNATHAVKVKAFRGWKRIGEIIHGDGLAVLEET
jgi:hypothetical protein